MDSQESPISKGDNESQKGHDQRLRERDGCLGVLRKNGKFIQMTNFVPRVTGFVKSSSSASKTAVGFLLQFTQQVPENVGENSSASLPENAGVTNEEKCDSYFLTWRMLSSQQSILDRIHNNSLWTAPSKEQMLPGYMKQLCDSYCRTEDARACLPVSQHGLQEKSEPPTWVYISNYGMTRTTKVLVFQFDNNKVKVIKEEEAKYVVIDTDLGVLSIADEFTLARECCQNVLSFAEHHFKENFGGFLVALGGLAMGFHYETLAHTADINVPSIFITGSPVSSKSKAVELLLSLIGMGNDPSVGDASAPGLQKLLSEDPLPHHWEDVSDVDTFEKVVKNTYNKAARLLKTGKATQIATLVMTANLDFVAKLKGDKEKARRILTRLLYIPFDGMDISTSFVSGLEFDKLFRNAKKDASHGILAFIRLHGICVSNSFWTDDESGVVKKIEEKLSQNADQRSIMNYGRALFFLYKILEDFEMVEKFDIALDFVIKKSLEHVHSITDERRYVEPEYLEVLRYILANPEKTKQYAAIREVRKCDCKLVLAFSINGLLSLLGKRESYAEAVKSSIKSAKVGCIKGNYMIQGHSMRCVHVSMEKLPEQLGKELARVFDGGKTDALKEKVENMPTASASNVAESPKIDTKRVEDQLSTTSEPELTDEFDELFDDEEFEASLAANDLYMSNEDDEIEQEPRDDEIVTTQGSGSKDVEVGLAAKPSLKGRKKGARENLMDNLTASFMPSRPKRRPKE